MNEIRKHQAANILASFEDEGSIFLKSQEVMDICKGRKAEVIGTKKTYGGKEYIKTVNGWKPVGKKSGAAKQAHDFVHGVKEDVLSDVAQDLYDKTMKVFKDNPSKQEWYLEKLREIVAPDSKFDDDHKAAANKMLDKVGNKKPNPKNEKDHYEKWDEVQGNDKDSKQSEIKEKDGIKVGSKYNHSAFGEVTVTAIEKNTGDKSERIPYTVTLRTKGGGVENQGINGFKNSVKEIEEKSSEKTEDDELDESKLKITENTQPYQGNKDAKWVRIEYTNGKDTLIAGVAIDKYDSKEKAIEAAKEIIKRKIKEK